ncbi:hypothetical protein ACKXF4_07035 [Faecalibacterium prausnitzii]|uniref:hypothetical protein n=1 Tax=Faecalibacterium prausnitzii TaxID=853 RepID=UPI003AAD417E
MDSSAGAGHGSTIADTYGNWWHASTMRISVNYDFERRVGLFPAGFDKDGALYWRTRTFPITPTASRRAIRCRQPAAGMDAAELQKAGHGFQHRRNSSPELAVNEDCRSWWSAAGAEPGEWLCADLGKENDVRAIQVNMADEKLVVDFPADSYGDDRKTRHIETRPQISHYTVETSVNGNRLDDPRNGCPRVLQRLLRICRLASAPGTSGCTGGELPYGQLAAHQRSAGVRQRRRPEAAHRPSCWGSRRCTGCKDYLGSTSKKRRATTSATALRPDKLYLSWLVYAADEVTLSTLTAGQEYYVCVERLDENGITPGKTFKLEG